MTIENIIFDLGGVLIDIDVNRSRSAFMELGLTRDKPLYSKERIEWLLDALERGQISYSVFRNEFRLMIGNNNSDEQLDKAWNAMLLEFPLQRIELLKILKKKYNTFLLSNTNTKHISEINQRIQDKYAINGLGPLFHGICYSYESGKRKPDESIFHSTMDKFGIKAEKSVFIDDTFDNVIAARKIGIQSYHLSDGLDLRDLFDEGFNLKPSYFGDGSDNKI